MGTSPAADAAARWAVPATASQLGVGIEFLYASSSIGVTRYRCRIPSHHKAAEQRQSAHVIAFPHSGAFVVHARDGRVLVEPNTQLFLGREASYSTSHPYGCGDSGSALAFSDAVMRDLLLPFDPAASEESEPTFRHGYAPNSGEAYLAQRLLVERLVSGHLDAQAIEETALEVAESALAHAYALRGRREIPISPALARRHRDAIEAVKSRLVANLATNVPLAALAREVSLSVFHLCRIFRRATGLPIHAYQKRLRLRASLERLSGGTGELSGLAFELGFSSHSHFTASFRREFGLSPSRLARNMGRART